MYILSEIARATNGEILNGNKDTIISSFSKDSRDILAGDFYIPIQGEKFDGHKYIVDAIRKGSIGFFVCDDNRYTEYIHKAKEINPKVCIIQVKDTLKALQDLAKYNRNKHKDTIVIGITGSVGKTSTKEMVASVLEQKYSVLKTEGNLNNLIGLPMMLLKLDNQEVAILEMGMNHKGEISELTNIAKPNFAVITNIGTAHIGILGSQENIFKAKMEIIEGLKNNGTLILNGNDEYLSKVSHVDKFEVIKYGLKEDKKEFDYIATNIDDKCGNLNFELIYKNIRETYNINSSGAHSVLNAMCAITLGKKLNMEREEIQEGLLNFRNAKMRMEIIKVGENIEIVNDAYNANYDSMKAGIEYVANTNYNNKILVLADMLELGDYSEELHRSIGKIIINTDINKIYTYGENSRFICEELLNSNKIAKNHANKEDIVKDVLKNITENSIIYFKGSRGMALEEVANKTLEAFKE